MHCDYCRSGVSATFTSCSCCGAVYKRRLGRVFLSALAVAPLPGLVLFSFYSGFVAGKAQFIDCLTFLVTFVATSLLAFWVVNRSLRKQWVYPPVSSERLSQVDRLRNSYRPIGW